MCWKSKYPPIRRSAPTSLIVYKVVVYISPSRCRSFIMWFDYIYKHEYIEPYLNIEELKDIYIYRWKIYRGFHSFVSLDKAVEEYEQASLGDRRTFRSGKSDARLSPPSAGGTGAARAGSHG